MNVLIGMIMIVIVLVSMAKDNQIRIGWNKENTIWFFKHTILCIAGLFLIVTVGGC